MAKACIITIGILLILMGTGTEAGSCVDCSPSQPVFWVLVWTGVIGVLLVLSLVGIAVYCWRRKKQSKSSCWTPFSRQRWKQELQINGSGPRSKTGEGDYKGSTPCFQIACRETKYDISTKAPETVQH